MQSLALTLTPDGEWTENPAWYRSDANPAGLDPSRWKAYDARYQTAATVGTAGPIDYRVEAPALFTVIEDLTTSPDAAGRFLLYRWRELPMPLTPRAVEPLSWVALKALYDPALREPSDVVTALEDAYATMDWELLAKLLAADYLFFLSKPTDQGEIQWDATEEARIHRRMFDAANLPAGEPPVPAELWLLGIDITLARITPFTERTDLYESPSNPGGLDPAKWKAMDARYSTFVFFTTAGEVDFRVEGEANFVVLEDLEKASGEEGKFLLYRWEDLDVLARVAAEQNSWSRVKALYRQ